ncbi:hypothetical protein SLS62_004434 [Diatrype stigma]|uniref:Uncharacterized protein n=1 Tax=Diatrype stigma TaxID=117547 RepID=A0AAN9YQI7_9PEZI
MAPSAVEIEDVSSHRKDNENKLDKQQQRRKPPVMKYQLLLASLLGKDAGPFGMDGALTTADVPPEFLGDVYMVGQVPMMALQVDPRISYALYVPPAHYNPDPEKYAKPAGKLPLLVDIHGTTRVFNAVFEDLRPLAESAPCAVLAPLFPAGIEGPHDLDSYKLIRSKTLRSDLALLAILDEVAYRWPGLDADRVYMSGYSGGGQFAQRFLYLYPERLAGISIGAPGRVTNLDDAQAWPQGVADVEELFNTTVKRDLIAQVPIQLVVGGDDTEPHGNEAFWKWVAEMKGGSALPAMDQSRVKTVQDLQLAWKAEGIESQLDIVPDIKHEAQKARETVLGFLQPLIQSRNGAGAK